MSYHQRRRRRGQSQGTTNDTEHGTDQSQFVSQEELSSFVKEMIPKTEMIKEQILEVTKVINAKELSHNSQIAELTQQLLEKDMQLSEKDKQLLENNKELSQKDMKLSERDKQLLEKDKQLLLKDKQLLEKDGELSKKNDQLTDKDKELLEREKELSEKEKEMSEKENKLSKKEKTLAKVEKELAKVEKELEEEEKELEKKEKQLVKKEKQLAKKEKELAENNTHLSDNDMEFSSIWKEIRELKKKLQISQPLVSLPEMHMKCQADSKTRLEDCGNPVADSMLQLQNECKTLLNEQNEIKVEVQRLTKLFPTAQTPQMKSSIAFDQHTDQRKSQYRQASLIPDQRHSDTQITSPEKKYQGYLGYYGSLYPGMR